MTEFKDICNALGGPNAVSRILGHKSSRAVRRACANNNPDPEWLRVIRYKCDAVSSKIYLYLKNEVLKEKEVLVKKNFYGTFNC